MAVRLFRKGDKVRRKAHACGDRWWKDTGLGRQVLQVVEDQDEPSDSVAVRNSRGKTVFADPNHMEPV